MNKRLALCLLLIILVGVVIRLYRVETLGTFRADQAIELSSAKNIIFGDFTLIGIKTSISEVRNGAVMYYFLAPLLFVLNYDPLAGAILQTGLQILTICVAFFIGKRFVGPKTGLLVAFVVSFSALLVSYSRQTLLAYYPLFFDSLIFFVAALLTLKFKPHLVLILGLLLGFSMQIHYSVIAVLIPCIALPFVFLRGQIWKYYLFLGMGFIIGFLPMIIFELRNELFNTKMLLAHFQDQRGSGNLSQLPLFWAESVGAFLFGGRAFLGYIFLIILTLWSLFNISKLTNIQKICWLFILGTIATTIVFSSSIKVPYNYIYHYTIAAFVPCVIWLFSILRKRLLIIACFMVLFFVLNLGAFRLFDTHGFSMSPNWTLGKIKKAARIIEKDNEDKKYNVAMLVDAETQAQPLRYLLDRSTNPPMRIDQYAEPQYLYVVSEPGTTIFKFDVWEVNSVRPFKIEKVWSLGDGYTIQLVKRVLQN